jgi:peroxiredoxin-like protein
MAHIHEYPVTIRWQGGRDGGGGGRANRSGVEVPLAVPPEFQGSGEGTNPEELLSEAIAACYTITYGIIAANRKLPVVSLETQAVGRVEQNGASFVYTEIVVSPNVTLSGEATDDQVKAAEDIAHKADMYCIVTNAVRDKVKVRIEPTIRRG